MSVSGDRHVVQLQYVDGDTYHFMDTNSYEQIELSAADVGEARSYLREQDSADLLTFDGRPIDIELPTAVVLQVAWTEPGVRGDTASAATKAATMDTGLVSTCRSSSTWATGSSRHPDRRLSRY